MKFNLALLLGAFASLAAGGRVLLWRGSQARAPKRYRPERHYMRGPGPQWHAKHDLPATAPEAPPGRSIES
jgi:hypothetical protein